MLDGRRIAYRAEGAGPLVVLLHASSSHSGQWKPYIEAWKGRYRLVAPDLHGYGRSDPLPPDGAPFWVHDGAIVDALISAEGAGSAHVVGHSLGGALGFYAAREAGARIRSLAMVEPVLFALLDEAGDAEMGERPGITAHLGALVAAGRPEAAAAYFIDFWSGAGAWERASPELKAYVTATVPRVLQDWRSALPGTKGQARLADGARLRMPVALWRGGATRPSARAIAGLVAGAIPGATLSDVPGADHMAAVFAPQLFIDPIGDFLDRASAGGTAETGMAETQTGD